MCGGGGDTELGMREGKRDAGRRREGEVSESDKLRCAQKCNVLK